jgi:hypothetical protein
MFRPTVSRPVCFGIKPIWGLRPDFYYCQLRVYWCGALSLTRVRICRLQLLLSFASAVFLGLECRGTRDHILLSQIRDFPFRRLPTTPALLVMSRKHHSSVAVQFFSHGNMLYFRSHYSVTVLVYLLISWSLHSNGFVCCSIYTFCRYRILCWTPILRLRRKSLKNFFRKNRIS